MKYTGTHSQKSGRLFPRPTQLQHFSHVLGVLGPLGASWCLVSPGASWVSWGFLGPPGSSWGASCVLLVPPGASWDFLGPPGCLCGFSFRAPLRLLVPHGASWGVLGLLALHGAWCFLGPPGSPGASWGLLGPPGASCVLLVPPGASWVFLGPPGSSWGLLVRPGPSWCLQGHPDASWASWHFHSPRGGKQSKPRACVSVGCELSTRCAAEVSTSDPSVYRMYVLKGIQQHRSRAFPQLARS